MKIKNEICFCNDVPSLIESLDPFHKLEEWRRFINACKECIKAVLFHTENKCNFIPEGYASRGKEAYDTLKKLLLVLKNNDFMWKISVVFECYLNSSRNAIRLYEIIQLYMRMEDSCKI